MQGPAAFLGPRNPDLAAVLLEDAGRRDLRLRIDRVGDAAQEEADAGPPRALGRQHFRERAVVRLQAGEHPVHRAELDRQQSQDAGPAGQPVEASPLGEAGRDQGQPRPPPRREDVKEHQALKEAQDLVARPLALRHELAERFDQLPLTPDGHAVSHARQFRPGRGVPSRCRRGDFLSMTFHQVDAAVATGFVAVLDVASTPTR